MSEGSPYAILFAFGLLRETAAVHGFFFPPPMRANNMTDYEKICDFQNLYKAHKTARCNKRTTREVIEFEMNLAENLTILSDSLKDGSYKMSGYYSFMVHDPKDRVIHALHYRDRVVQHCICDEVLAPTLDKKLVYDNAACRIGKGTHFAMGRLSGFMHEFYNQHGTDGYFLKCDVRKFFDNIDHDVLKSKLSRVFKDDNLFSLLCMIIDSYEKTPGKGLPLGNQTSQWFAIYYLDGFDRLIKEKFHIKYYTRYMDDCVLLHHDKEYLKKCLKILRAYAEIELHLTLNEKTEIFPIKNGVDYLGWHFYMSETGKIIRKVRQGTKNKYKRRLRYFETAYAQGKLELSEIEQVLSSYYAHLSFGHTYALREKVMSDFVLCKSVNVDKS